MPKELTHWMLAEIPPCTSSTIALVDSRDAFDEFLQSLKGLLVGKGSVEIITNTLVSKKHVDLFPDREPISLQNPISPDTSILRTSLIPSMLDALQWNIHRATSDLRLFEVGKVFVTQKGTSLPQEKWMLCLGLIGSVRPKPYWADKETKVDFYHAKGMLNALLDRFHLAGYEFCDDQHRLLEDRTSQAVRYGSQTLGFLGSVKNEILHQWDIKEQTFIIELDLENLYEGLAGRIQYKSIPKFPVVKRDLAIVVDETTPAGDVKKAILTHGGEMLRSVDLFDLYRGDQLDKGEKSMAFSLVFSVPERTLREEEVEPVMGAIIASLKHTFRARLRS